MKKIVLSLFLFFSFSFAFENSIGLGVFYSQDIYVENEDKKTLLPSIFYENGDFYFKGIELGYKITPQLSLIALPNLQNSDISSRTPIKETFFVGIDYKFKIQKYGVGFKVEREMGQRYDGFVSKFSINHPIIAFPYIFIPSIGLEYESEKTTNYYYGVPKNSLYPTYTPKESMSLFGNLIAIYNINSKYALQAFLSHKFLSNQITNSPIVDTNSKSMGMISLLYKF